MYDLPELHRGMIRLIGFENADKIVPKKDEVPYRDPVSENAMVLQGKPVKAFPEQDHEAHLMVHTNAMKDPKLRALIGQSPNAQVISGAMEAHIAEHLGFAYRNQIQQSMGIEIPPLGAKMDPMMENQLSRLMADASQKVLQQSQAEVAQKEAMAQAQDPLNEIQRQELQIKAAEVDRKTKKDMSDATLRSAEIAIRQEEVQNKKQDQDKKLASEETIEGFRAAINLRKGPSQRG